MAHRLLRIPGLVALTAILALGASAFAAQGVLAAAPTITNITPMSGPVGTVVEIDGTNFVPGSTTVMFGATTATNVTCTSTTVCFAIAPGGVGAVTITVTTAGNPPATSVQTFTYTAGSATPAITNISPTGGPAGTPITITGTNLFPGGTSASFGGTAATVTCTSSTSCTTTAPTVPFGTTVVAVTVQTPSGTSTNPVGFSYTSGFGGCPAGTVLIGGSCVPFSGSGFCPAGTVLIGGGCVPLSGSGGCPAGTVLVGTTCQVSSSGFNSLGTVQGTVGQTLTFTAPTNTLGTPFDTVFSWNFGDGGTATGPTVTHVYSVAGTYTVTVTATSASTGISSTATGSAVISGTSSVVSPISLSIIGSSSATVGQSMTFTASFSTGVPGDAVFTWNFGDGTSATGQSVTHTFSSAGTYNVTVQMTSASQPSAGSSASFTVTAAGPTTTAAATGPSVTYQAGWNLVSGQTGTVFSSAANPLYTLQPGDTNYETLPNTSGITGGRGYWAYFTTTAAVTMNGSGGPALPLSLSIPAGEWVMVGNPSPTQSVTVSGADVVYTYSPGAGSYQGGGTSATLQPGQAAWVYSNNGATITIR